MEGWLTKQLSVPGGIPIQNWMLAALVIIAVGIAMTSWADRQ
jgi:hypothetical protein